LRVTIFVRTSRLYAAKADMRLGGVRAFYSPKHDFINRPPLEKFWNAEPYYGTLVH
jgi:antirestriction protein ArdC